MIEDSVCMDEARHDIFSFLGFIYWKLFTEIYMTPDWVLNQGDS